MGHFLLIGASGHLGSALIMDLLSEGHSVGVGTRHPSKVHSMTFSNDVIHRLFVKYVDVRNLESIDELVRDYISQFGTLDAVIFVAGKLGTASRTSDVSLEDWNEILDINLTGAFRTLKCTLPVFESQGFGSAILISGGGASSPLPTFSPYAVAKVGLVRLVENVANEYPAIQIVAVAPGIMPSKMVTDMVADSDQTIDMKYLEKMTQALSEGRDSTTKAVGLIKRLLAQEIIGVSGKFLSAEWDDWSNWLPDQFVFNDDDVYTLRRKTT